MQLKAHPLRNVSLVYGVLEADSTYRAWLKELIEQASKVLAKPFSHWSLIVTGTLGRAGLQGVQEAGKFSFDASAHLF